MFGRKAALIKKLIDDVASWKDLYETYRKTSEINERTIETQKQTHELQRQTIEEKDKTIAFQQTLIQEIKELTEVPEGTGILLHIKDIMAKYQENITLLEVSATLMKEVEKRLTERIEIQESKLRKKKSVKGRSRKK